jgi:nitroreductase
MNERLAFLFGRRSIRVFAPGEVEEGTVREMLEAAMSAPSAVAKDPWRFVIVRDRPTLERLAGVLPNGQMIGTAAVGIAVCGDLEVAHDHQLSYLLQDCGAAIQNILLAGHALGLGCCWLGVHPREERVRAVRGILGLPERVIPVSCIAVGRPGEAKEARTRYRDSYVFRERWTGG